MTDVGERGPVQEITARTVVEVRETSGGWSWRWVFDGLVVLREEGGYVDRRGAVVGAWDGLLVWLVEQRAAMGESGWGAV